MRLFGRDFTAVSRLNATDESQGFAYASPARVAAPNGAAAPEQTRARNRSHLRLLEPERSTPENGAPKKGRSRMFLAGISAALALFGIAVAGRARRRIPEPQRLNEASNRVFSEVSRFAQELAHEIRNPLTAINARLYKLQKKLPEGSPEYRDATIIENEIKRLDQMLETFRKLGCQAPPQRVPFRVDTLLQEISDLFAAELEPQGIQIQCEHLPALKLQADAQQIKQVLINLIKNAAESILHAKRELVTAQIPASTADALPERGLIVIRLHTELATLQGRTGPAAIVEVEDNGPGIAEPVRSRLLEPFFSTKEHGTGLGLPIAARIIAQHGGALEFESQSNQGTIFRLLLPMEVS